MPQTILIEKFTCQPLERHTPLGGLRHYRCPQTGRFVPSVTSVLDHTADKTGLIEWRQRVGEREAERIKREALGLGTLMHTHLECHITGRPRPTGNNLVRLQAEAMADQIITNGLAHVSEFWGSELGVYCRGLVAGTLDSVGVLRGVPSVFDFKSARKMKKLEHITDYELQVCAYISCMNEMFGCDIRQGVIFMVDRDFNYQEFIVRGDRFTSMTTNWLDRLAQYYAS